MERTLLERANPRAKVTVPRAYGSLGTLTVLADGHGLYRSSVGDLADVGADLIARLGLIHGARLHARVRSLPECAGGQPRCEIVRLIAWYVRGATVVRLGHGQAVLQIEQGPLFYMPHDEALAAGLSLGDRIDLVAAPGPADRPPWRVVQVGTRASRAAA